jgi:hypothetical protein
VDQTPGTTPPAAATQGPTDGPPAETPAAEQPGFGSRGRIRRRARFLRRARELAYRDLGGLVFNLHRFGERNDALVLAKLSTLSHIDTELRTIEKALGDRRPITVLREAGITACPRCAAIHGSEDRFCPNCGLPLSRNVDLPIGAAAPVPAAAPATTPAPATAAHPTPATPPAPGAIAPNETPSPPAAPTFKAPSDVVAAPAGGRAPVPPARGGAAPVPQSPEPPGPEESTEILHPPASST